MRSADGVIKKLVSDCCMWTGEQRLWICETYRVSRELTLDDKPEPLQIRSSIISFLATTCKGPPFVKRC
jgi:hypothetical protein